MKPTIKNRMIPILLMTLFVIFYKTEASAESLVEAPGFSVPGGLYTEEFELSLSTDSTDADIYYTIDGSIPAVGTATTHRYTEPVKISFTALREQASYFFCGTVIRAVTVTTEGNSSNVVTASYFLDPDIGNRYQLPIISITTDPANLYDSKIGIMAPGLSAQRGIEWERPIHFEYFDKEGNPQISIDAGIRMHGAASRGWAFKSFRVYARTEYDDDNQFEYDFFSDSVIPALEENGENKGNPITKFKRLILRNGGNEGTAGDGTLFRDALSQALMEDTTLDLQAYSPAITFINGEYYGIHNVRERQDEKYIEDHYNIDENEVILYEFKYGAEGVQIPVLVNGEESDLDFYNNMLEFVRSRDLSIQENYEQMKQWLDIGNFVDYQIINIYGANRDWPGNNCKAWRIRTDYDPEAPYGLDGRLRWLLYDTDFNFGLYDRGALYMDSLADATMVGGKVWPTQDGATLLLRKLLENEEFKTYFCQRFLDLINTNYDKDYANSLIDQMAALYRPSIEEFKERYRLLRDWDGNIETVKDFISQRGSICKNQLSSKFDLGTMFFLSVNLMDNGQVAGGKIVVNTVTIDGNSKGVADGIWKKSSYEKLPTVLTAVPDEGYEFVSWSGSSDSTDVTIEVSGLYTGNGDVTLMPIFRLVPIQEEDNNAGNSTDVVGNADTNTDITGNMAGDAQNNSDAADNTGEKLSRDNKILILCVIVLLMIIVILVTYYIIKSTKSPDNRKDRTDGK